VRQIREGARYVSGIPWLWVTITLFAIILMLQLAPQQVLLPKLVKEHFDHGVGAYGVLSMMVGIGTLVGTLAFGQLQPHRRRGVLNYWLFVINSFAIAALALVPWFSLALGLALARGVEVVREEAEVAPWPVRPGVEAFSLEAGRGAR
jgi:cyanate permease